MAQKNSFDIVSEIVVSEVSNAVNQASKEATQRYDLKKADPKIELIEGDTKVVVNSADEFSLNAVVDILGQKLIRRGVSLRALDWGEVQPAAKGTARREATIRQGIPLETSREIVKAVKNSKLKAQVAIQGESLRVSGKDRDTLQAVIALLKDQDFGIDLQFTNYRS